MRSIKPLTIAPDHLMLGDRAVPTDTDFALPITYYGPRRTIRTVSAQSVFDGTLDRAAIENRIVVIGASVSGGGDFYPTPFDSLMPGVEVISTAITHLVAGDGIVRDRKVHIADALAAILLPMLLVGLLAWRRSALGLVARGRGDAGVGRPQSVRVHARRLAECGDHARRRSTAGRGLCRRAVVGRRPSHAISSPPRAGRSRNSRRPPVQEWLAARSDFLAKPVRQNAAVVFIDLSGFTALSERIDPDALRDLAEGISRADRQGGGRLWRHGHRLSRRRRHDPVRLCPARCRTTRPCAEVLDRPAPQRRTLDRLAASPRSGGQVGFKIGAHFGPIVASRLGESHQHITATGDTVNVASRLMEVAAQNDARLALSDTLLDAADFLGDPDSILSGPLLTQVRGRSGTILTVWFWRDENKPSQAGSQEAEMIGLNSPLSPPNTPLSSRRRPEPIPPGRSLAKAGSERVFARYRHLRSSIDHAVWVPAFAGDDREEARATAPRAAARSGPGTSPLAPSSRSMP